MSVAAKPDDVPRLFLKAFNASDVDEVVSLYETDGVIAVDANQVVAGQEAIRSMVTPFLAQRPRFTLHESDAVQTSDLALIRPRWTVAMIDPAGKQTEMHIRPTLVLRRHPSRGWLVAIDRPMPTPASESAIPILPAVDLEGTHAFFETLGFRTRYSSPVSERGYLIVTRGDLELHFFSHPHLGSVENYAGCYWRVKDADTLHAEYSSLGLPSTGAPSLSALENKPWGMREFALLDPNSNLVRVGHDL